MKSLFSQMFQIYSVLEMTWKAVSFRATDAYIHELFSIVFLFLPTRDKAVKWIMICKKTPPVLKRCDENVFCFLEHSGFDPLIFATIAML